MGIERRKSNIYDILDAMVSITNLDRLLLTEIIRLILECATYYNNTHTHERARARAHTYTLTHTHTQTFNYIAGDK